MSWKHLQTVDLPKREPRLGRGLFGISLQWNLDLTKSLGTGQICSLDGGLVIS